MRKILLIVVLLFLTPTLAQAEVFPIYSVEKVYNGDSITVVIEIKPFDIYLKVKARLDGIDTPELRTNNHKEKELAIKARDYTKNFLERPDCFIEIRKQEKYGRWLCEVYSGSVSLNKILVSYGYAREYSGGKRQPWFAVPKAPDPLKSIKEGLESLF